MALYRLKWDLKDQSGQLDLFDPLVLLGLFLPRRLFRLCGLTVRLHVL